MKRAFLLLLLPIGCVGEVDARCERLCNIEKPAVEGAYDMCDQASADTCVEVCTARIEDTSSLCGTCLLEQAYFRPTAQDVWWSCDLGACTLHGREGSCGYPEGDEAAMEDCLRRVFPRRTVMCSVWYESVTACAEVCADTVGSAL